MLILSLSLFSETWPERGMAWVLWCPLGSPWKQWWAVWVCGHALLLRSHLSGGVCRMNLHTLLAVKLEKISLWSLVSHISNLDSYIHPVWCASLLELHLRTCVDQVESQFYKLWSEGLVDTVHHHRHGHGHYIGMSPTFLCDLWVRRARVWEAALGKEAAGSFLIVWLSGKGWVPGSCRGGTRGERPLRSLRVLGKAWKNVLGPEGGDFCSYINDQTTVVINFCKVIIPTSSLPVFLFQSTKKGRHPRTWKLVL